MKEGGIVDESKYGEWCGGRESTAVEERGDAI